MVTAVSMYQVGKDGSEQSITPFGGIREVTGGTWPAKIWLAYMKNAVKDLPEKPLFSVENGKQTVIPRPKKTPYQTAEVPSPPPPETIETPLTVPSSSASENPPVPSEEPSTSPSP